MEIFVDLSPVSLASFILSLLWLTLIFTLGWFVFFFTFSLFFLFSLLCSCQTVPVAMALNTLFCCPTLNEIQSDRPRKYSSIHETALLPSIYPFLFSVITMMYFLHYRCTVLQHLYVTKIEFCVIQDLCVSFHPFHLSLLRTIYIFLSLCLSLHFIHLSCYWLAVKNRIGKSDLLW